MMPIYIVWIDEGFGGVAYFQEYDNADEFANEKKAIGCKVRIDKEYATPQEYVSTKFNDPIREEVF